MLNNIKEALIGDSSKDISRNIRVVIKLTSSLPFITLSQSSSPGTNVNDSSDFTSSQYNCSVADKIILKRLPNNLLVDPVDPDRYLYVGVMASYVQSLEMDIYYDATAQHLFCIPSLIDMGDTPLSKDLMKNQVIALEGYGLGVSGGALIDSACSAIFSYCKLSNPVNPFETKLNYLRIPGKTGNPVNNQGLLLSGGDVYVEGAKTLPSEFISLGSTATIGTKVPAWKYVRTSINKMHLFYVGEVALDDILVPLPL